MAFALIGRILLIASSIIVDFYVVFFAYRPLLCTLGAALLIPCSGTNRVSAEVRPPLASEPLACDLAPPRHCVRNAFRHSYRPHLDKSVGHEEGLARCCHLLVQLRPHPVISVRHLIVAREPGCIASKMPPTVGVMRRD